MGDIVEWYTQFHDVDDGKNRRALYMKEGGHATSRIAMSYTILETTKSSRCNTFMHTIRSGGVATGDDGTYAVHDVRGRCCMMVDGGKEIVWMP